MVGICINLSHMQSWFGGDFASVIPLIQLADDLGLDQVSLADHLLVSATGVAAYPYGAYYQDLDYPWPEPIAYLAALAGATRRIALSIGVMIAPLRPAVLLAKQLATLDVLSRGRVVAGFGVGWQREEYDAAGIPWAGRFIRLEEQIQACRALWRDTPATFAGKTVGFTRIHALPKPVQPDIPIWLGLGLTERNAARIVALAAGWLPLESDPEKLAADIGRLRKACLDAGRDLATLGVRATLLPPTERASLSRMTEAGQALIAAGVTVLQVYPGWCCRGPEDCGDLLRMLAEVKVELARISGA
jgi:probable F420-dependent oxidoreductase